MSVVRALETRARNLPAAGWLTVIVVCSILVYFALAHRIAAPWIFIDEIVYSELAQSFAAHGTFLLRGVPSSGYGPVYPLLIAPAWRLFGAMPDVYLAVKAINSVAMSLTAIPAYLLARRWLPARLALVAATLTVLVPDMLYTGMVMTENAFYPLFVTVVLLLQLTLERPTLKRQVALLVVLVIAYETRPQATALLAAIATAPLVLALIRRGGLRMFAPLYGLLAAGAVAALAVTAARGESIDALLGAYEAATSFHYTIGGTLHFLLYHSAEFDLLTGAIPFAAMLALWFTPRVGRGAYSTFVATSFSVSLWLLIQVAAFASATPPLRIQERYMFYLAPLAFIALLIVVDRGAPAFSRRALAAAALVAGVLPFFTGFSQFLNDSAISGTFSLLPWFWTMEHGLPEADVRYVALACALVAAAVFLLHPRRFTLLLPVLVGAYLIAVTAAVENSRFGIHNVSVDALWAGTELKHPDWIDRAVGRNASVVVLWNGTSTPFPVWEDGFFNRSVGTVYDIDGAAEPDPLPEVPAVRAPSGALESGGRPVVARYVLTNGSFAVGGRLVDRDPSGYALYRVDGPVAVLSHVSGLYIDTWSGRSVSYERFDCKGGTLAVRLETDPSLFHFPQTVIARENGQIVGRAQVSPAGKSTLRVPLYRTPRGRCVVTYTAEHLLVPAKVIPGSTDPRHLGAHFFDFVYTR